MKLSDGPGDSTARTMPARLRIASDIVEQASVLALGFARRRGDLSTGSKRANDPVSEADVAVEAFIRSQLASAFPQDAVLGEEGGGEENAEGFWAIDPIDGTTNFLRGSPLWAISVGFVRRDRPHLGIVAIPVMGELVAGEVGFGLFSNGRPFERGTDRAGSRVISLGDSNDDDLPAMQALYGDLRREGWIVECYRCSAIGLAFSALGIIDGHVQPRTTIWDMAGGAALCSAAGLHVEVRRGMAPGAWSVSAGAEVRRPPGS